MKFDLLQLLFVFDEELPLSDEERGLYWFKFTRKDGSTIQLNFSTLDETFGLILRSVDGIAFSSIMLRNCVSVNVLDENKRQVEILTLSTGNEMLRCFLDLQGDNILEMATAIEDKGILSERQ